MGTVDHSSEGTFDTMSELPQPAEVKIWTFRQLLEWLKRYQPQFMDNEDFRLLEENKYSGAAFLVCDKDEFVAAWLPRGIAVALDDIVRRIRGCRSGNSQAQTHGGREHAAPQALRFQWQDAWRPYVAI